MLLEASFNKYSKSIFSSKFKFSPGDLNIHTGFVDARPFFSEMYLFKAQDVRGTSGQQRAFFCRLGHQYRLQFVRQSFFCLVRMHTKCVFGMSDHIWAKTRFLG